MGKKGGEEGMLIFGLLCLGRVVLIACVCAGGEMGKGNVVVERVEG